MAELIDINHLTHFREVFKTKKIGVTFSCWDLLHAGHHIFLTPNAAAKRNNISLS